MSSCIPSSEFPLLFQLRLDLYPDAEYSSLDRSNLGNAATAGLAEDTNLKGDQYNLLLTLYYVMFVVFGPIMTVLTKVFTAKVSLPAMMLSFGIASAATSVANNLGSLIAVRIIVGIFESGFLASYVKTNHIFCLFPCITLF